MSARPTERAGYTTNVFVLDCSASMSEIVPDPELDRDASTLLQDGPTSVFGEASQSAVMKTKLEWAKEYVVRKITEQTFYNRKTEHCMVIATGDRTNNPYEGYEGIDVVFSSYMAAPWMVGRVQNVRPGAGPGDVLAGMSIALSSLQESPNEMKKPSWTTNFHIITDGQSELSDADVQITSLVQGLRFFNNKSLVVIGYGFQDKKWKRVGGIVPQARDPKLLAENEKTLKDFTLTCRQKANCPDAAVMSLSLALSFTRAPQLRTVKPTARAMPLRIAVDVFAPSDSPDKRLSLTIPVKVAKMTDASTQLKKPKINPVFVAAAEQGCPSKQPAGPTAAETREAEEALRVALAETGMRVEDGLEGEALVEELEKRGEEGLKAFNPEQVSLVKQLRFLVASSHVAPADRISLWNVLAVDLEPKYLFAPVPQAVETDQPTAAEGDEQQQQAEAAEPADVPLFEPEDVTRGHKFGSDWIPIDIDPDTGKAEKLGTFQTEMGIDVCKFIPASSFDRAMEMAELRYIWADPKSAKSQIELSSLIRAMVDHPSGQMLAVMRFVYNQDSAPFMIVARGVKDDNGDHLECVRVPFQDDYRRNYFPSLEFPKNEDGDLVTEHSTLPTDEQKAAMGELIDKSILDTLGEDGGPWYTPELSYNPSIHTLKAFQQHQAIASPTDRPPAMHQDLTRFFKPPAEVVEATKGLGKRVADVLDLRPVPPKKAARSKRDIVVEDESVNLLEMFGATVFAGDEEGHAPAENGGDESVTESESEALEPGDDARMIDRADKALDVFSSAWDSTDGAGDTVASAIEDLGKEITSLVGKGSKDQALRCIKEMRVQCLQGEESLAFNEFMFSLKASKKSPAGFWPYLRAKGGRSAGLISFQDDKFNQSHVSLQEANEFLRDP